MEGGSNLSSKIYTIPFEEGFHARPVSLFTQAVKDFEGDVNVKKGQRQVDGKSMLQLMTLGLRKNDEMEVTAVGEEEQSNELFQKLDELFKD